MIAIAYAAIEVSDLNFFITVKVVNQTINLKDVLKFQPIKELEPAKFTDVFGDTFISGFLEGGEFNALVSMKVLNKEKVTDIKAAYVFNHNPSSIYSLLTMQ